MSLAFPPDQISVQAGRDVPLERARGLARLAVDAPGGRIRLAGLHQSGSLRIRLPRRRAGAPVEAVLLNTAGGATGGDRFRTEVAVGAGAEATVTTQAAERIYRSPAGHADIETGIAVAGDGRLAWIPQETILFNRSALVRRLTADLAPEASLLAAEAVVLGRTAMGERITGVAFADSWRIRRGGRLVFADATRLEGDAVAAMAGKATGGGAVAFATLVLVASRAESRVEAARAALDGAPAEAGVSGLPGLLVARLVAASGQALRAALARLIETLRGSPMPRVWTL